MYCTLKFTVYLLSIATTISGNKILVQVQSILRNRAHIPDRMFRTNLNFFLKNFFLILNIIPKRSAHPTYDSLQRPL